MPRVRQGTAHRPTPGLGHIERVVNETPTAAARALGACVYAVRTPDRLVKIGYTGNISRRIGQLGAVWTDVLLAVPADMAYERAMHDRFAPFVARGREYYFPVREIMDWINTERGCMHISPTAI